MLQCLFQSCASSRWTLPIGKPAPTFSCTCGQLPYVCKSVLLKFYFDSYAATLQIKISVYLLVKCKLIKRKKYCIFSTAISCKTDILAEVIRDLLCNPAIKIILHPWYCDDYALIIPSENAFGFTVSSCKQQIHFVMAIPSAVTNNTKPCDVSLLYFLSFYGISSPIKKGYIHVVIYVLRPSPCYCLG